MNPAVPIVYLDESFEVAEEVEILDTSEEAMVINESFEEEMNAGSASEEELKLKDRFKVVTVNNAISDDENMDGKVGDYAEEAMDLTVIEKALDLTVTRRTLDLTVTQNILDLTINKNAKVQTFPAKIAPTTVAKEVRVKNVLTKQSFRRERFLKAFSEGTFDPEHNYLFVEHNKELLDEIAEAREVISEYDENFESKLLFVEQWEEIKKVALENISHKLEELQLSQEIIDKSGVQYEDYNYDLFKFVENYFNFLPSNSDTTKNTNQYYKNYEFPSPKKPTPRIRENPPKRRKEDPRRFPPKKILELEEVGDDVIIGPYGTTVSKAALWSINWTLSGAAITRKILMEVFDRETLASHTLTGKPSPAFMGCKKPLKYQLDPEKVADVMYIITSCLHMKAKEVRNAITTKCADENKMYRQRMQKMF